MIVEWLKQTVFASKLVDDVRGSSDSGSGSIEFAFELPAILLEAIGDGVGTVPGRTRVVCALFPPEFRFYFQLIFVALLQSIFNAVLGVFVYKIVVEPQRKQQQQQQQQQRRSIKTKKLQSSSGNKDSSRFQSRENSKDNQNNGDLDANADVVGSDSETTTTTATALLFALGIAMPCVVLEPIYAIAALEIQNLGLVMLFLATPIVNSLRLTEALGGFAPFEATTSLRNYVLYFSCPFGMEFDSGTGKPKRVTNAFLGRRLRTLGRDYIIVTLVICVLEPYGYEFFDTSGTGGTGTGTGHAVDSMDHTLSELISWKHLGNNFLVAFLISASLSQSSLGVSLVYNLFYGVQTYEIVLNPMLKSRSPSDFWGRRWNMLVHKCLKNGVYKPTRKHTSSKFWGVLATFLVSGIIHEYVNYVMFNGFGSGGSSSSSGHNTNNNGIEREIEREIESSYTFAGKQMMFFGWNGVLIGLEYGIGHWAIFRWMSRTLPSIVVTGLVLCSALPLAHLFTGDWIRHGYFDAIYLVEPVVVCRRSEW